MRKAPQGWHNHSNGGGLIEDSAHVEVSSYIGENAQVCGDARVFGDAQVFDNAQVCGDARVSGNAWVFGDAQVCGDARVSGNAWVSGDAWDQSPLYIQGSRHALTNSRKGHIQIGCHERTFEDWKKHGKAIARVEGYTSAQIKEYGQLVDLFIAVGK